MCCCKDFCWREVLAELFIFFLLSQHVFAWCSAAAAIWLILSYLKLQEFCSYCIGRYNKTCSSSIPEDEMCTSPTVLSIFSDRRRNILSENWLSATFICALLLFPLLPSEMQWMSIQICPDSHRCVCVQRLVRSSILLQIKLNKIEFHREPEFLPLFFFSLFCVKQQQQRRWRERAARTNLYQPPALFLSAPLCIQLALLKWRSKSFSLSQGGRCYCWMPENIYSLILLHSSWLNTCCRHCYIPARLSSLRHFASVSANSCSFILLLRLIPSTNAVETQLNFYFIKHFLVQVSLLELQTSKFFKAIKTSKVKKIFRK